MCIYIYYRVNIAHVNAIAWTHLDLHALACESSAVAAQTRPYAPHPSHSPGHPVPGSRSPRNSCRIASHHGHGSADSCPAIRSIPHWALPTQKAPLTLGIVHWGHPKAFPRLPHCCSVASIRGMSTCQITACTSLFPIPHHLPYTH